MSRYFCDGALMSSRSRSDAPGVGDIKMAVPLSSGALAVTDVPERLDRAAVCTRSEAVKDLLTSPPGLRCVVTPQVKREKGRSILTPSVKAEIKKLRWVKGRQEEEDSRPVQLSIDRNSRYVSLSGDTVPLEVDGAPRRDCRRTATDGPGRSAGGSAG